MARSRSPQDVVHRDAGGDTEAVRAATELLIERRSSAVAVHVVPACLGRAASDIRGRGGRTEDGLRSRRIDFVPIHSEGQGSAPGIPICRDRSAALEGRRVGDGLDLDQQQRVRQLMDRNGGPGRTRLIEDLSPDLVEAAEVVHVDQEAAHLDDIA